MTKKKVISKQTSGLAIASLILGITALIPAIGFILGVTALVLGIIALVKIKKNKNIGGKGMAITGIVLGSLGIISTVVIYGSLFYFGFVAKTGPFAEGKAEVIQQTLTQNAGYLELYKKSDGKYPDKLDDLTKKGYPTFPVDFYMQPLYYKALDDGQSYDLRSIGPDGKYGTSDDILPIPIK